MAEAERGVASAKAGRRALFCSQSTEFATCHLHIRYTHVHCTTGASFNPRTSQRQTSESSGVSPRARDLVLWRNPSRRPGISRPRVHLARSPPRLLLYRRESPRAECSSFTLLQQPRLEELPMDSFEEGVFGGRPKVVACGLSRRQTTVSWKGVPSVRKPLLEILIA